MFPSFTRRAALALAALGAAVALAVGLAASAGATVSATPDYTTPAVGVAGAYIAANANQQANGDHDTGVRASHYLRAIQEVGTPATYNGTATQPNLATKAAAAIGVELCQFNGIAINGQMVTLFTQYMSNGQFGVFSAQGTGICDHGVAQPAPAHFTYKLLDQIPANHTAYLAITESAHHVFTYTDEDLTNNTGASTSFGGFLWTANRAGWGTEADGTSITAPATNKLSLQTGSAVRDNKGWVNFDRKGLTRQVVVKVICTSTGTSAGQALIQPELGTNGKGDLTLLVGNQSNS